MTIEKNIFWLARRLRWKIFLKHIQKHTIIHTRTSVRTQRLILWTQTSKQDTQNNLIPKHFYYKWWPVNILTNISRTRGKKTCAKHRDLVFYKICWTRRYTKSQRPSNTYPNTQIKTQEFRRCRRIFIHKYQETKEKRIYKFQQKLLRPSRKANAEIFLIKKKLILTFSC